MNIYETNIERAAALLIDMRHASEEDRDSISFTSKDIDTLNFLIKETKKAEIYRRGLSTIITNETELAPEAIAEEMLSEAVLRYGEVSHYELRPYYLSNDALFEAYNGMKFTVVPDSEGAQNSYKIILENGKTITAWSHEIYFGSELGRPEV